MVAYISAPASLSFLDFVRHPTPTLPRVIEPEPTPLPRFENRLTEAPPPNLKSQSHHPARAHPNRMTRVKKPPLVSRHKPPRSEQTHDPSHILIKIQSSPVQSRRSENQIHAIPPSHPKRIALHPTHLRILRSIEIRIIKQKVGRELFVLVAQHVRA
jgi:hypothetical protein